MSLISANLGSPAHGQKRVYPGRRVSVNGSRVGYPEGLGADCGHRTGLFLTRLWGHDASGVTGTVLGVHIAVSGEDSASHQMRRNGKALISDGLRIRRQSHAALTATSDPRHIGVQTTHKSTHVDVCLRSLLRPIGASCQRSVQINQTAAHAAWVRGRHGG